MKIRSVKLVKESFVQGVLKKINKIFRPGSANMDDFDWRWYHYHYQAELSEIKKVHTQVLSPGDYTFSNGILTHQSSALPLHPNHRLLYETILQLGPSSILEVGCGGGIIFTTSVCWLQTLIFMAAIYQMNNYLFYGVGILS